MPVKVIGYLLLVSGIALMLLSAYSVYSVFTKQSKPVQLFNLSGISLDLSQLSGYSYPGEAKPSSGSTQLLPAAPLNDVSNLTAHLILMGFMVSIGYKLGTMGIQMLRPIEVQLKTIETSNPQATSP